MARQPKVGLDYFELDCHMNEKIELIEAEYGLKGFAIIVKLYQNIYGGFGYYCEWTPDISLLWARRLGVSQGGGFKNLGKVEKCSSLSGFSNNLINNVVSAAIKRGIFSAELFQKYQILTSVGIQERYLNAVSRREKIELKKEYLLIPVDKNQKNVVINKENVDRNSQSRVEKSREEKNNISCSPAGERLRTEEDFEIIYALYPKKVGKAKAYEYYLGWLKGRTISGKRWILTNKEMYLAVKRYVTQQEEEAVELKFYKGFDTFMNKAILDYLEEER